MAQCGTERNTRMNRSVKREKSRNWAFTLNNPMEAEILSLQRDDYEYIFQEETGESGTPHLQGTICLKDPQALSYMKKINGRAHWEVCRNKFASINYCQKGESRTGEMYTNINVADKFGTNGTAQNEEKNNKKLSDEDKKKLIENMMNDVEWDLADPNSELSQDLKKMDLGFAFMGQKY